MLPHRTAEPDGVPRGTLLCVHGYPQSSYMWQALLDDAARAGWLAIAPDLPGYGDAEPDPPHTWERMSAAVGGFWRERCGEPVVLCVHDWGGLIGLRFACDLPEAVRALVISGTGFFPDGRWHGFAEALRTPGQGEQLIDAVTRESFAAMLRSVWSDFPDASIDEYYRAYDGPQRRAGQLELYRSGDFALLEPYADRLAKLDVPALVLWGAGDAFAPVGGARRFARELPQARLEILEDAGHFVFEETHGRANAIVTDFLASLPA